MIDCEACLLCPCECDPVKAPSHYTRGIEHLEYMRATMSALEFRGAMRFNASKYIRRAGAKGDIVEDLRKAVQYLERWISHEDGTD